MTSEPKKMNLQLEKLLTAGMAVVVGALSIQSSPVDAIASTCKPDELGNQVCIMADGSKVQFNTNQARSSN